MANMNPWKTGVTLAATLAIAYTVCSIAYALAPERGVEFVNALSHGLDFRKLGTPAPLTFLMFFYPLVVLSVWGFLVGALYAWLHKLLHGGANR